VLWVDKNIVLLYHKGRLEIHKRVHNRNSKIREYGSPEFNEYRLTRHLINLNSLEQYVPQPGGRLRQQESLLCLNHRLQIAAAFSLQLVIEKI